MASSSAHKHHNRHLYNLITAPPPTPLAQPNTHHPSSSSTAAADELSSLLLRLPPTLSLPTNRRSPRPTQTSSPPVVSLSALDVDDRLLSACCQLGYFQLSNHNIVFDQLAESLESETRSLFELSTEKKSSYFPKNWPLGFDEEEEENSGYGESFWLDSDCSTVSTQEPGLELGSLRELTRGVEKAALEIVEILSRGLRFDNPTRFCTFMIVSDACCGGDKPVVLGGAYPYVVGLHYRIGFEKCWLLSDSGWVWVSPQIDSILVTIGDIAQVWSNGKVKKVRGRPVATVEDGSENPGTFKTLSLLLTLPVETTISPLLPKEVVTGDDIDEVGEENEGQKKRGGQERLFSPFSLEDYAWRVYHEPLLFKDPLDRYRV